MKAIIYEQYGGPEVLTYTELKRPEPKDNEVLVKVIAASVSQGDRRLRAADPFLARIHSGLLRPKRYPVLGFECAGAVEEVGKAVSKFKKGDEVMIFAGFQFGAYADYIAVQTEGKFTNGAVVRKPENLSFEEAAVSPVGGITALGFLKDLGIDKSEGKEVLVLGASGSVGTYALQIAKHYGSKVTAVCSGKNAQLVKNLGADHVVDYTAVDIFKAEEKYDVVFDAVGLYSRRECQSLLKKDGRFASVKKSPTPDDRVLQELSDLMAAGHVRAVIDRAYEWEQIVEAHTYVDGGHKAGNVVLHVNQK